MSRTFRLALFLVAGVCVALPSCADTDAPVDEPVAVPELADEPAKGVSDEPGYYNARMIQTLGELHGSHSEMVSAYQRVLDVYDVDPLLAARAALELAEIAAAQNRRRVALDLIARASAIGTSDRELVDRASRLRHRLADFSTEDIEVRGPPAKTTLVDSSLDAARLFSKAEELLASYLRRRQSSRLEEVKTSVQAKRAALEAAARAYRQVIELGEPVATVAAEFRIASMYDDLSLSLSYGVTHEMVPAEARRFRAFLRGLAISSRQNARAGYRRSLEAAQSAGGGAQRWREAATLGLVSVEDLLGGG